MSRKFMSKKQKKQLILSCASLALVLCVAVVNVFHLDSGPLVALFPALGEFFPPPQTQQTVAPPSQGTLRVHILDVGQGDCILVQGPEKVLVIDGGEADQAPRIIDYLSAQGVTAIDYYLNTHPHSDHYGGIRGVMEAIPTRQFLYHRPPAEVMPSTRSYQKLLGYLGTSKIPTTDLAPGDTVDLGGGALLTIVGPTQDYEDMNNLSLVGRLTFGQRAFLFTGDMEAKSEKTILASGAVLAADVYSAPHHGSSTSSTKAMLKAVSPTYATVSAGANNDYGHPHRETLALLSSLKVTLYRTDLRGNIIFDTDGQKITVTTDRGGSAS